MDFLPKNLKFNIVYLLLVIEIANCRKQGKDLPKACPYGDYVKV